jgi:anti-sigma-K factor RskA
VLAVAAVIAAVALVGGVLVARDDGSGRERALARVLGAPDVRTVRLAGTGGTAGTLRVVYSRDLDVAYVVGSALPDPGEGRTYQLWSVSDDVVRSAGVFDPTPSGSVDERVALPRSAVQTWGVTNEPTGGSPVATTDMVFRS